MTIAAGFTGPAERDGLQNRDIIFNHCRFTDHNAGCVIEHNPTANFCRRVNVYLEANGHLILQEDRQRLTPLMPQPVTDTVGLKRMKTLQVQKWGGIFIDSRVTRTYRLNITGR